MERGNFSACAGFAFRGKRQAVFGTFAAFQEMILSEVRGEIFQLQELQEEFRKSKDKGRKRIKHLFQSSRLMFLVSSCLSEYDASVFLGGFGAALEPFT